MREEIKKLRSNGGGWRGEGVGGRDKNEGEGEVVG